MADHKVQHINKELSHINLSEEQSNAAKEILFEFRTQLKEFKKFKDETELKKKDLFLKDYLSIHDIETLDKSVDIMAREIEKNFLTKMHSLLSIDQRISFVKYIDDWEVK
ncbi:hypothetical protein FCU45_05155 [Sulfurimonas crateris]|uniref:Periplasmic heavy metal sensor n=2 Tax=Sulfurimonas crateris TaxID=2574727 RepID=A0A4V5TM15_9BACT|nr:hypothetical protein FCU45_05155 [Sulfurimonas crateris]